MPRPTAPALVNRLPRVLRQRGMSWSELSRRTLLPPRLVARLQPPAANPRLAIAERVATALGLAVEALWTLPRRPRP